MENKKSEELIENSHIKEIFKSIESLKLEFRKKSDEKDEKEAKEKALAETLKKTEFAEKIEKLKKFEIFILEKEGSFEEKINSIVEELKTEKYKNTKKAIFPFVNDLKVIFGKEKRKIKSEISFKNEKKKADSALQSKISKLRVESGWEKNLNSYSSDLTSLARLIQINLKEEPCVSFYFDQKKLYYSTNNNSTIDSELKILNSLKKGNYRDFLNSGFKNVIKELSVCNEINVSIISINDDLKKLYQISVLDPTKINFEVEVLKNYCQEIIDININKNDIISSNRIKKYVSNASVHAYDLMRIYILFSNDKKFKNNKDGKFKNFIVESDHEIKSEKLKEQVLKLNLIKANIFTENTENFHVHCECTMCQHIIGKNLEISKEKIENILNSIVNKNFTISKFCCQICETIFSSLEEGNSDRAKFLGNSSLLFSNYKSPVFTKNEEFEAIKKRVMMKIEKLKKDCSEKTKEYLENNQQRENDWDMLSMENSNQIIKITI